MTEKQLQQLKERLPHFAHHNFFDPKIDTWGDSHQWLYSVGVGDLKGFVDVGRGYVALFNGDELISAKMGDSTDTNEDFVFFTDSNGVRAIFKKLTND